MKSCTKCGLEKPPDQFGKHKARRDGIDTFCLECRRADNRTRMAKWRAVDPERARERARRSQKALRERDPDYYRRWYQANIDKERERSKMVMRKCREENPEGERERKRRYRAANLEAVRASEREKTYARRAKQPFSPELAAVMQELVAQPCVYCGSTENVSIDHIVPLSRGGKHEASNLAPACFPCNASKCNRLLSEWDGRLAA